jgi:two-component system chemotaxis sensor kinase CheA
MDKSKYKDLFVSESREHLQALSGGILDLEREPDSAEALERISRSVHTLKGMAAMMGYEDMMQLAHDMEDLMAKVHKGTLAVAPMLIDLLSKCMDALNTIWEDIVADRESQVDLDAVLHKISQYQSMSSQGNRLQSCGRWPDNAPNRANPLRGPVDSEPPPQVQSRAPPARK